MPARKVQFTLRVWADDATAAPVEALLARVAERLGGKLGRTEYSDDGHETRRTGHRMVVAR